VGSPAAVMGDKVTGQCAVHMIPNPVTGAPQPAPPMPFSAPLLQGLATKVLIGGKPAAVQGSTGYCLPPHVGLHPADPFMVPTQQTGMVLVGSPTVLIEGKPAATASSTAVMCASVPGTLLATGSTVLIG
jgi:uncharacterized Zn-binding protein involved in type VI secretion